MRDPLGPGKGLEWEDIFVEGRLIHDEGEDVAKWVDHKVDVGGREDKVDI